MIVEQCANFQEFSVLLFAFNYSLGIVEDYDFILATNNSFHLKVYIWIAIASG